MVLSTEWSQVEIIDLTNDGNGLGFILVGGKSTGVVIKALVPGGVSARDGRLQCGDHVLQIGNVNLRGFSSEQVATVLRQTGPQVRIVVARPVETTSSEYRSLATHAPIIPTKILTDPVELERQLIQTSIPFSNDFIDVDQLIIPHIEVVTLHNDLTSEQSSFELISPCSANGPIIDSYISLPETEKYDVELRKNVYGLGITVAGYVCEEEDLSGIFVKSIIEGSAAEMSGKIQINDRIVAVDGKTLAGVTNHQAVEVLRNTDIAVWLTLERFLRGRKFEHLQVALTESKERPLSLPPSPSLTTLTWVLPKSDADSIVTEDCDDSQIDIEQESCTTFDSNVFGNEINICEINKDSMSVTPIPDAKNQKRDLWEIEYPESEIIVTEINKLSGLGISIEGTVEVEGGVEKRPHHFIRSILNDSPVAIDGKLRPGDELLQVNEHKLTNLVHTEVVKILKELPNNVKVVCARGHPPSIINTSQNFEAFESRSIVPSGHLILQSLFKAQSESSLFTSSTNTNTITDQNRSRSMEQVSGLALWSNEIVFIDIEKTERGFGFSVLDYQDPLDNVNVLIVVRGLIPGGSAEKNNLIFPGDRIISVGEHDIQGCSLDEAVSIMKSVPVGLVRIGLCRPLCTSDNNITSLESPT
ncbi:patj homolog isoform X2 [Contarinia nasturtii]|uniref:patj homolog isoform X2 n=1 Tax=Contarinia nasturtii TaxID=265458 RepID=UPI0012D486DA|nr:patj homolog isoform X2 [Contarinia nasturtii]